MSATGFVLIGRDEGERLRRCLASVVRTGCPVVYVDSGSRDGSVAAAQAVGATVVALDMAQPFTAARARNAGWRRLLQDHPGLQQVHFLDGDCELVDGWLPLAEQALAADPPLAVVCGRRRERHPEASVFNRLCDIEWNTPPGPARACGGDALVRVEALTATGGYRDELIAGEEPELCVRIRAAGWGVRRLDADMTWHDAAMSRWGQWWQRTKRAGHAFAEGAALHGAPPERHGVAQRRRALLWGLLLPTAALLPALTGAHASLLLLLAYPVQVLRLALRPDAATRAADAAWLRAFFLVLGRFPEAAGVLLYHWRRLLRRRSTLIEYK